ncbi:hypothetical protein RI543_003256 [Arxiozyma heterogenica]|uniref:Cysteine-rich transmembrane domain-containing protein n=1 Tax=Arxiozyma heterogenica TaxID=278026 RepID=A0AAN7WL62_9SACH|nr:hypothetical protein RI543_003256 [Kazachstania heterogenica]
MSAKEYYQGSTEQPNIPKQTHQTSKQYLSNNTQINQQSNTRGLPPQQGQYYQSQPQPQLQLQPPYQQQQQQQQYYPYQNQQHPSQPMYVQQAPPQRGNNDCLAACLATMCLCCTLDMLF